MHKSPLVNFVLLACIAAAAYFFTLYLDTRTPPIDIIIQPEAPIEDIEKGQEAPNFTFTDTNGKTHALRDFKGKIIILNFWASWCPPCIKEFPHFITAAKEFENDVVFIGISSDLNTESMNKFLDRLGADIKKQNILIALDEDQNITKNLFQTYRLPETVLIDVNQHMHTKIIGADWDYAALQKQIRTLQKSRDKTP
ncbi:MAG: TlpA disulfide reductase family protein [Alphaproteobacteria bacterium]